MKIWDFSKISIQEIGQPEQIGHIFSLILTDSVSDRRIGFEL